MRLLNICADNAEQNAAAAMVSTIAVRRRERESRRADHDSESDSGSAVDDDDDDVVQGRGDDSEGEGVEGSAREARARAREARRRQLEAEEEQVKAAQEALDQQLELEEGLVATGTASGTQVQSVPGAAQGGGSGSSGGPTRKRWIFEEVGSLRLHNDLDNMLNSTAATKCLKFAVV